MKPVILHVEDEPYDAFFLRRAFEQSQPDWLVHHVKNAEQAIDYLSGTGVYADRSSHPLPALVFLDLKLPGRSGFEVLGWIRAQEGLADLRVVVLTASDLQRDRIRAGELGASAYLVKTPLYVDAVALAKQLLSGAD